MKQGTATSVRVLCVIFLASIHSTYVQAQDVPVPHEALYQLLEVNPEIQPYSTDLFGDKVDMATGSLSFEQIDVSLRGSFALPVEIRRSFTVGGMNGMPHEAGLMGDWTLEIPRIRTLVAKKTRLSDGTFINEPHWEDTRCDEMGDPVPTGYSETTTDGFFYPKEFWYGYFIDLPGSAGGEILERNDSLPDPASGNYAWTTKNNVLIRCLSNIAVDGAGNQNINPLGHPLGQGFEAITPDGTRYVFDRMVYRHAGIVEKHDELGKPLIMTRYSAEMQVSRVEDRFGNWVKYEYDNANRPVRIIASDGREIDLVYNSRDFVWTVTVNNDAGRVWTYNYDPGYVRLDSVLRPDERSWQFNLSSLAFHEIIVNDGEGATLECGNPLAFGGISGGSITHPLGAEASFTVAVTRHNRIADLICFNNTMNLNPPFVYLSSIVSKQITGAGFAPMVWTYGYSENLTPYGDVDDSPAITEKWVDVKTPEGNVVRHYASMNYSWQENVPTRTVYFREGFDPCVTHSNACNSYSASDVLRTVMMEHVAGPQRGITPHFMKMTAGITRIPRMVEQTITEEAATFTREAAWDPVYDRITAEEHFSSSNNKRKRVSYAYHNDNANYSIDHLDSVTVTDVTGGTGSATTVDVASWNSDEQPLQVKRFGAVIGNYTYEDQTGAGNSLLKTYTDALSHTVTFNSYKLGIPQDVDYPDATSRQFFVDGHGQITSITDQRGYTTAYEYDSVGRVDLIDYPDSDTVLWASDDYVFQPETTGYGLSAGHHRRLITTDTHQVQIYFDALLRPVLTVNRDVTTGEERFTRKAFDSEGRVIFASYPSASASASSGVESEYDPLGRLVEQRADSELGVLTTTFAYDNGRQRVVTDPRGNATTYTYEAYDAPDYSLPTRIEAPEGQLTEIDYDIFGNMTSVTQSGSDNGSSVSATRSYFYDANKRLCRRYDPETGSTIWRYDAAGRVDWYAEGISTSLSGCGAGIDASVAKRDLAHDELGRLEFDDIPGSTSDIAYGYDLAGNLNSISNGGAVWTYTYNMRNLHETETLTIDSEAVSFEYVYNNRGQLAGIVYPSGYEATMAPNAYGEPTQVGHMVRDVAYYPNGAPRQWMYANGVVYNAQQNVRQLPSSITHSGVQGYGYLYDANGNISAIDDLQLDPAAFVNDLGLQYDGLNRLIQADGDLWGRATFAYDSLGNLRYKAFDDFGIPTLVAPHERAYKYDPVSHLLTGITDGIGSSNYTHQFLYGTNGNITNTGSQEFEFDAANRMTEATGKAIYHYDGHGRRVKIVDGVTSNVRYMAYTQDGLLRYERDVAAGEQKEYYYLGRTLIASADEPPVVPALASFTVDSSSNDGAFTLSWSATNADSYILQQRAPDSASWTTLLNRSGDLSYSAAGRSGGTWTYRLTPCNATDGCGSASVLSVGVTPEQPVITLPSGTQSGAYTISWTKPYSTTSFTVQEYGGASWTTILSGSTATSIVRPQVGGTFQYRVLAANHYGNRGYVTAAENVNVVPAAPASISRSEATSLDGLFTVSWPAATGASSYELRRRVNGGAWVTLYTGAALSRAEDITAAGTYDYAVRSCNFHGCTSTWRGDATVSVQKPSAVAAPANSKPDGSANGAYTISWNSAAGATSYQLQRRLNSGSWSTVYNSANRSFAESGRADGNWSYRVYACSRIGCSAASGTTVAFVEHTPSIPTGINSPDTSESKTFTVTWNAVSPVNTYELQWRISGGTFSTIRTGLTLPQAGVTVVYNGTHEFRVRACRTISCSGYSGITSTFVFAGGWGSASSVNTNAVETTSKSHYASKDAQQSGDIVAKLEGPR